MTKEQIVKTLEAVIKCLQDEDEEIEEHYDCKEDLQNVIHEL